MHVLAFFGVLAILLVRIAHPPAEPVQPPVGNAAELTPEQRARSGATAMPQQLPAGDSPERR
jgi:hypothetical protein